MVTKKKETLRQHMLQSELRTPVHGIITMAQELSESTSLGDREKETSNIISDCANHLISLTNDVLDFEKVN